MRNTARDRLIDAAGAVFAQRGYEDATVSEISIAAGANIAAINYHFGDKRSLYREVLKQAISRMQCERRAAPEMKARHELPPDVLLREMIKHVLHGVLRMNPAEWQMPVILREFIQPSADLADLMKEELDVLDPENPWQVLVATQTGFKATDPRLQWSIYCLLAPALLLCAQPEAMALHFPALKVDKLDLDAFAEHLAGHLVHGLKSFKSAKRSR